MLLSGGVDSSLALHLLKAAGHKVTAFYLKIWFQDDFENFWSQCPWEEDLHYCQQVGSDTHLAAAVPDNFAKLHSQANMAATPHVPATSCRAAVHVPKWAFRPATTGLLPINPSLQTAAAASVAECPLCLVQVCDAAGVPLEVVPLTEQYWDRVVAHSISEIRAGHTPNPDVLCNSRCGD